MWLNRKIMLSSFAFGLLTWVLDATADSLFFYDEPFLSLLVFDVPTHEIFVRSMLLVMVVGFGVTASWITENLRTRERELSLFRSLIDAANDSVFVIDTDTGQFVDVNDTAVELLGYDREELLSMGVADISSVATGEDEFREYIRTEEGLELERAEFWHQRADGSKIPVEVSAKTVAVMDSEYRIAIARDITRRKERERHLRTLIGNLPGIAYRCKNEPGWPMELVQGRSAELTGYTATEIENGEVSWGHDIIHPEDREYVQETVQEHVEQDEPFEISYRIETDMGEQKWVWEQGRAVSPLGDSSVKLEGFITDITERKTLEQRLSVVNRVLRHDIRSAVNVIEGNARLAKSANSDVPTVLETILHEAERLHDLSENARLIEEAISGDAPGTEPIDLVPLVEAKLHGIANDYPDVSVQSDLPDSVRAEASFRLEEALDNVLKNAIVHNDHDEPEISVEISENPDWVELKVKDNGPGIPEDELQPIKEGVETDLSHTSGLGLWVVKWTVNESGGQLHFAENDPRGTVVTIQLPAAG